MWLGASNDVAAILQESVVIKQSNQTLQNAASNKDVHQPYLAASICLVSMLKHQSSCRNRLSDQPAIREQRDVYHISADTHYTTYIPFLRKLHRLNPCYEARKAPSSTCCLLGGSLAHPLADLLFRFIILDLLTQKPSIIIIITPTMLKRAKNPQQAFCNHNLHAIIALRGARRHCKPFHSFPPRSPQLRRQSLTVEVQPCAPEEQFTTQASLGILQHSSCTLLLQGVLPLRECAPVHGGEFFLARISLSALLMNTTQTAVRSIPVDFFW